MDTRPEPTNPPRAKDASSDDTIAGSERFFLWLFVVVFLGFGCYLIGDLVLAFWR